ncbi:hypothetical protein [Zoogloea sp.]|uniref:hypothetical protein n=1 Tax=Zoogloea sp. TaxID=49181 RepID=UPI0035B0ADFD
MEPLDYWRLLDEMSVKQAALLAVGVDPASEDGTCCEGWKPHERPSGYEAVKAGICVALMRGRIKGTFVPIYDYDINGNIVGEVPDSVDVDSAKVDVDSLRSWFSVRGFRPAFFFPETTDTPDYLDPSHSRYSSKLAAAVKLWQAMDDDNLLRGKAPTVAMREWLESRYRDLGLIWNGDMNKQGMDDVIKVANWKVTGGATATPGE